MMCSPPLGSASRSRPKVYQPTVRYSSDQTVVWLVESAGGVAPVGGERAARDPGRLVAREKEREGGDLLRSAEALERIAAASGGHRLLRVKATLGQRALHERRPHRARADRVRADAMAAVLHGELPGQRDHAALGGRVRGQ